MNLPSSYLHTQIKRFVGYSTCSCLGKTLIFGRTLSNKAAKLHWLTSLGQKSPSMITKIDPL